MKRRVTIAFPPIQSNHNPYKCGLSGSTGEMLPSASVSGYNHHHHHHHHHYTNGGCSLSSFSNGCCHNTGSSIGGNGCGYGNGQHSTAQCDFNGNFHVGSGGGGCSNSANGGGKNGCCGGGSDGVTSNVANDDWRVYTFIAIIAVGCYLNGIQGDFVHDDIPAITINKDVLGLTPITHVFRNDFWGTPMSDTNSHKSYRPLTTLSFR